MHILLSKSRNWYTAKMKLSLEIVQQLRKCRLKISTLLRIANFLSLEKYHQKFSLRGREINVLMLCDVGDVKNNQIGNLTKYFLVRWIGLN